MPHLEYRSKSIAASFGCPPFLFAINLPLDVHGVNFDFLCRRLDGHLPLPRQTNPGKLIVSSVWRTAPR